MSNKDEALVEYIVANTESGRIRWEPTASNSFIAPLRGDNVISLEYNSNGPDWLYLRNREGQLILSLNEADFPRMKGLFERARRNAYDVDKVIDEILGGGSTESPSGKESSGPITDEDIPF